MSNQSERQISISRLLDAPRALVYRVFTEPQHVAHWWGPFGFRNTVHEMNVKVHGVSRFTMHGPKGGTGPTSEATDYPNEMRYLEVVPNERLVFTHGSGASGEEGFHVEITFADEGTQTRVVLTQTHASAARVADVKKYAVEGGNQTFTRLAGYLASTRDAIAPSVLEGAEPGTEDADFILTRVFKAPRALVFDAMLEPEHLAKWFGPAGVEMRIIASDLRVGGMLHYSMKMGANESFGRTVYRDLKAPERFAYVVSFTDANFEPVRHPLSATWPLEVLGVASLVELDGQTLLTMRSIPIHVSDEERATFRAGHTSMTQGWKGSYDQLEAYLATVV